MALRVVERLGGFVLDAADLVGVEDEADLARAVRAHVEDRAVGDAPGAEQPRAALRLWVASLAPGAAQYEPASTIASLPAAPKSLGRRSTSVTVRPVALRADDPLQAEPLVFTNYTLRLAGEDRKLCTADDLFVRDGLITRTPPPSLKPCKPAAKAP